MALPPCSPPIAFAIPLQSFFASHQYFPCSRALLPKLCLAVSCCLEAFSSFGWKAAFLVGQDFLSSFRSHDTETYLYCRF